MDIHGHVHTHTHLVTFLLAMLEGLSGGFVDEHESGTPVVILGTLAIRKVLHPKLGGVIGIGGHHDGRIVTHAQTEGFVRLREYLHNLSLLLLHADIATGVHLLLLVLLVGVAGHLICPGGQLITS